jgi:hypothetical protein
MKKTRVVATMLVLLLTAGAIAVIASPGGSKEKARPPAKPALPECASCHSEIAREAAEGWHSKAYTDPEVLDLTDNFRDESCISCHAPMPIFATGIGERVHSRNERRETGVDCISCHLDGEGRVVGTRGLAHADCQPVVDERLKTASFCAGCHNQHWTVDEFMESRWSETHTCNSCHMPRVDRPIADGGPVRQGVATHVFPGSHDLDTLRAAASLEALVEEGELVVRVTNVGAGHKIPTDSRHKSYNVLVTIRDAGGNLLVDGKEIAEYRLYYREENKPSTQILPEETREHRLALPEERSGRISVQLIYCSKPPAKHDGSYTVVHTLELEF